MGQKTEPTGLYQYEAYIGEEVHMAEFFHKYEFISVDENDVFTFKDKILEEKEISK